MSFGLANSVTGLRALLAAIVAGFVLGAPTATRAATIVALGAVAAALDGVDGWLARRTRTASDFGARFDMEVDAAFILVLSILTWRFGKAGAWVLASGLMRYAFVAAGWRWPWLQAPLFPSLRRRAVCAAQIVSLLVALAPFVPPSVSSIVAAAGLAALTYSFTVDVLWLGRDRNLARFVPLAGALVVLDASLTFANVWPTPAIWWRGQLSIELAVCILALALLAYSGIRPSRRTVAALSAAWTLLVVGHYAEVTAPALYGRDVNLYFDLRYIPDVVSMATRVTPVWLIALSVCAIGVTLFLIYRGLHWAIARVSGAMLEMPERRVLTAVAVAGVALFAADRVRSGTGSWVFQKTEYRDDARSLWPSPVTSVYARQARLAAAAFWPARTLPPTPTLDSDLSRVRHADVFLIFVESYGATTFDRPEIAGPLSKARGRLAAAIHESGRQAYSAYVESPTYGGSSWLAHLSLLSGVDVRDPDTHARLMTERRDTLVRAFGRQGFRTVALMPGLRGPWPEGAFYGFDEIYGADRLAYHGPEFGWFAVPDQFSLERFDALEPARGAPRFVFFPTISPHFPFSPTPPYQPDWHRLSTSRPFDGPEIVRAYAREPDWIHFAPGYVEAMAYDLDTIAGYLRLHAADDLILILLGDHQPPALVSGEGATWEVPVHVVAASEAVGDRLLASGFRRGLTPARPSIGRMHTLAPLILQAFGSRHGHPESDVVRSQVSP